MVGQLTGYYWGYEKLMITAMTTTTARAIAPATRSYDKALRLRAASLFETSMLHRGPMVETRMCGSVHNSHILATADCTRPANRRRQADVGLSLRTVRHEGHNKERGEHHDHDGENGNDDEHVAHKVCESKAASRCMSPTDAHQT